MPNFILTLPNGQIIRLPNKNNMTSAISANFEMLNLDFCSSVMAQNKQEKNPDARKKLPKDAMVKRTVSGIVRDYVSWADLSDEKRGKLTKLLDNYDELSDESSESILIYLPMISGTSMAYDRKAKTSIFNQLHSPHIDLRYEFDFLSMKEIDNYANDFISQAQRYKDFKKAAHELKEEILNTPELLESDFYHNANNGNEIFDIAYILNNLLTPQTSEDKLIYWSKMFEKTNGNYTNININEIPSLLKQNIEAMIDIGDKIKGDAFVLCPYFEATDLIGFFSIKALEDSNYEGGERYLTSHNSADIATIFFDYELAYTYSTKQLGGENLVWALYKDGILEKFMSDYITDESVLAKITEMNCLIEKVKIEKSITITSNKNDDAPGCALNQKTGGKI